MNILVIEDDTRVADFIKRGLKGEGWSASVVDNGEAAIELLGESSFDLIVLDIMLPGLSGLDVCRRLRWDGVQTPVLMLTALDNIEDIVSGLKTGADDYLVKPFNFEELVARLEALHRRPVLAEQQSGAQRKLSGGGLELDQESLIVTLNGETVDTTTREREILTLFLNNPSRVLARERILNAVWGNTTETHTNVVDVYIARLRKKLNAFGEQIKTVHGVGYRFDPVDAPTADTPAADTPAADTPTTDTTAGDAVPTSQEEEDSAAPAASDTRPEFDRLTSLTRRLMDVPVVILSVIDGPGRQLILASLSGLEGGRVVHRTVALDGTPCQFVHDDNAVFRVDDVRQTPPVARLPIVADLPVGAYLGVPVRAPDGAVIGVLCVIDHEPRAWTGQDVQTLQHLAASIDQTALLDVMAASVDDASQSAGGQSGK